jgi:aminocarboxymuconate-semialdehyde decarboxylase
MIDVHAHLFFDELLGEADEYGPRVVVDPDDTHLVTGAMSWRIAHRRAPFIRPADRVEALDQAGIDLQIASISPLWLFHHAEPALAERFARRANDLMAQWCVGTNGRVRGLAQLPTQDADAAARELTRAVTELGLIGGFIGSDARVHLDDPDLDPLYTACERLDVPLFIHAAMPGIDGPAGDPRLKRWIGDAVLGYPWEDTIAVSTLLLSDVLDRHPGLDVCFSHGGGTIPYLMGRLHAFAGTAFSPVTRDALDQHLQRLWFDDHLHSSAAARLLRETADPTHIVYGSNFGGWDFEAPEAGGPSSDTDANARVLLRL